ncbi:VOC family protein [Actinokineospora sp. HUAS TT18]|uniref:VOC family protein n=1 Tax=Actinokineospora sp. HUAS TT18 TaxID=3447451 RepID=UPI003F527B07
MSTRLASVVIEASDPTAAAEFWYVMLGGTAVPDGDGGRRLVSPEIGACDVDLVFVPSKADKVAKNRIHVDLATESPHEYHVLTSLAADLGARALDVGQGAVPWTVFQDLEGNEFCVLEPRELYTDTGPLAAVVIDAIDPVSLAAFWSAATGWPLIQSGPDAVALRPLRDRGPWIEFLRVPEPKRGMNRIRFDIVSTEDTDPTPWLLALGATRDGRTLADPEGNEFRVLRQPARATARRAGR